MATRILDGFSVNPDWKTVLDSAFENPIDLEDQDSRCQLVFSLLVYLNLSLLEFLCFVFESRLKPVRHLAGMFMGYRGSAVEAVKFAPQRLYEAWNQHFPRSRIHLYEHIIKPWAKEKILEESNNIILDKSYTIIPRACTMDHVRKVLKPGNLVTMYGASAPFTWDLLSAFTVSPNRYRKYGKKKKKGGNIPEVDLDDEDYLDSQEVPIVDQFFGETGQHWHDKGFVRNPTFTLVFVISMMVFTRNTPTNLFPTILGLFLEIGGTGSRVMTTLSNAGVCISISTIERLKKVLSDDAKAHAIQLMKGPTQYLTIFDNINIFLRKFQQRLFNKNSMIHATNAAVIALPNAQNGAADLRKKMAMRGKRAQATGEDIKPTEDDDDKIYTAFEGLVAHMVIAYCPGNAEWKDRGKMIENAENRIPRERPLPPRKTDARPLGVFDVNEGSKVGIITMLKSLQETSGLSEEEWSSNVRIIGGDWLTTSNFRSARRDRSTDINGMERLEYVEDISQLFHFALNASHMLMRLHFGNPHLDPGSLAKHKGLLNRTWDAMKPNYADAKALIRHSLISRILYSLMLELKLTRWAQLAKWSPTPDDITKFAEDFVDRYANSARAREAKSVKDDYLAHSIYFIRDALMFCEFEHAVSHADAGRVLRVLKYWIFLFRGAGLHNYARECLELTLRWKYELSDDLRLALEESWFVNRWGLPGRWIAADLYVEQLNFWVKRVFIAKGSGVTIEYIIEKGSSCVEIFREVSHLIQKTFGYTDRSRNHNEVEIEQDLRLLAEDLFAVCLHIQTQDREILSPAKINKKNNIIAPPTSMIQDGLDTGAKTLHDGKFTEFIRTTTWDPAVGYPPELPDRNASQDQDPLINGTAFDSVDTNPISGGELEDLDDGDDLNQRYPGMGGIGGGGEF